MSEIIYRLVNGSQDPVLDQVKFMFREMYMEMGKQGLMLPLSDNGADKWLESLRVTVGRFGILAIAQEDGHLVGFGHGALKWLPEYLGNLKAGVITHLYIQPPHRKNQIGRNLVLMLEKWFAEKKVHSIELQVISANEAKAFWEKVGYDLELFQYRKFPGSNT